MRRYLLIPSAALGLFALILFNSFEGVADNHNVGYVPVAGDQVVIYTHKFKPEAYRKGLNLISQGFTNAQKDLKHKRQNIILTHPSTHEVLNISFFHKDSDLHDWHEFDGRKTILKKLKPLLFKPIDIQVYGLEKITNSTHAQ